MCVCMCVSTAIRLRVSLFTCYLYLCRNTVYVCVCVRVSMCLCVCARVILCARKRHVYTPHSCVCVNIYCVNRILMTRCITVVLTPPHSTTGAMHS